MTRTKNARVIVLERDAQEQRSPALMDAIQATDDDLKRKEEAQRKRRETLARKKRDRQMETLAFERLVDWMRNARVRKRLMRRFLEDCEDGLGYYLSDDVNLLDEGRSLNDPRLTILADAVELIARESWGQICSWCWVPGCMVGPMIEL